MWARSSTKKWNSQVGDWKAVSVTVKCAGVVMLGWKPKLVEKRRLLLNLMVRKSAFFKMIVNKEDKTRVLASNHT